MSTTNGLNSGTSARPVFVTGASGYIGGRLVPRLLDAGYRVRCLARSPEKLEDRSWAGQPGVEIVSGDIVEVDRLSEQMSGCGAAYYLAHSMVAADSTGAVHARELARCFALAANRGGCERILYLGGLGETCDGVGKRQASRRDIEAALASGPVPLTVFRAAVIIGSGSASLEILRYLVERQPLMVAPRWVRSVCQPISVRNVLHYLVAALEVAETIGRSLDIGGPGTLSYRELMDVMADALGLPHRVVITLPLVIPRLSSMWIHMVTPLDHSIALPLSEGLRNRAVCRNSEAAKLMPQPLLDAREAIDAALGKVAEDSVETSWSDAGPIAGDPDWAGGATFVHREEDEIEASAPVVFRTICRIGGRHGWFASQYLWRLRGWMDRVIGGPGLGRGRRTVEQIRHGDALDFWRVTGVERDVRLELRGELKVPGEALLEFRVEELGGQPERIRLDQIARFKPKGLLGLLYWYSVLPLHGVVFRGMVKGIRTAAEREEAARRSLQSKAERRPRPTL
jgi:uncharacterized protein YbjT (DUF2867 family)